VTSGNLAAISATMTGRSRHIRSRHPPIARWIGILADKEAPVASEGTHESDGYASGTIFPNRKLNYRNLVMALALSVHSVKGKAAAQLQRGLGVDYKTAFVLPHKLPETVAALREQTKLTDVAECAECGWARAPGQPR
jgi:hypothetical protein